MFNENIGCLTALCAIFVCGGHALTGSDHDAIPPPLRQPAPAPFGLRGQEPYTNMTIDQLILKSMGGINAAQGLMLQDGKILAELDMMLTDEQFYNLYEFPSSEMHAPNRKKRKAVRDVTLRWPDATVPYTVARGQYNEQEKYWIKRAMTEWERYTCVRFRPAVSTDRNVVRFQNGYGCNSELGMVGGIQVLNLESPSCRWKGLYLHELGHAMGLVHEHQLPSRDEYITINYQNVEPSMRIWFNKYNSKQVNQFNVKYEYSSAMHYGITAFSRDGRSQTIRAKYPDKEKEIGQVWRKELSFSDVKVVNLMYQCASHCSKNIWCTSGGYVDQNCRCICPDGSNDCQVKTTPNNSHSPDKDNSCTNKFESWRCAVWANQGECEKNREWMELNCAKACGICGVKEEMTNKDLHLMTWSWQLMGLFRDVLPRLRNVEICKNEFPDDKCSMWRKRGDCATNPGWMTKHCKKACNFCEGTEKPETNCRNSHSDTAKCDQWAVEGECQVNRIWMESNCQKACRVCTASDKPDVDREEGKDDEDTEPCVNSYGDKECTKWANTDECRINPTWMIPNCRKACQKCHDGKCKNLERDDSCDSWRRDGECTKSVKFMKQGCALACGFCQPKDEDKDGGRKPEVDNGGNDGKDVDQSGGDCYDIHNAKDCKIWADFGHCDKNPSFMLLNCKHSCKVCSGSGGNDGKGGGTDGTKDTGVDKEVGCVDDNDKCPVWAESKYCDSNAGYMLANCRKSCDNCKANCKDTHMLCPIWGKGGHCSSNANYMLRACQKTCKVCKT
ncbi:balbiani ring protein 3-like [Liolophura sinensis]|uniref:balbiani ring protein 3-like n=1 Tax=Liolophura sinensis TaxID=3198878 RepID=UPI0031591DAC